IGMPAVKVIVPGLRHFWARFAPGRLYDVPVAAVPLCLLAPGRRTHHGGVGPGPWGCPPGGTGHGRGAGSPGPTPCRGGADGRRGALCARRQPTGMAVSPIPSRGGSGGGAGGRGRDRRRGNGSRAADVVLSRAALSCENPGGAAPAPLRRHLPVPRETASPAGGEAHRRGRRDPPAQAPPGTAGGPGSPLYTGVGSPAVGADLRRRSHHP